MEWLTSIGLQDFRIAMMKIGVEEEDDVVGLVEESDLQSMGMSPEQAKVFVDAQKLLEAKLQQTSENSAAVS